ncbi:MAG: hypothetical protein EOP51_13095 [Sphingobacteriales bacterium]|nr:MAG: hypothetical protein EOP51_13095 [Sphingobacteriales bacterium]
MKKYLPHILVIVGFILLALFFCYPQLEGKQLVAGDQEQWKGMSQEIKSYYEKTGEPAHWSNSMFGGMPTYTYYNPKTNNLPFFTQDHILEGIVNTPASFLLMAMICFYILGCVQKWDRWVSIAGAVIYAFSTYNIILIIAGHNTKMYTIAYLPAMIAGLLLVYRSRYWTGIPLLAIALAFMIANGHYQVLYYVAIMILFIVITFLVLAIKQNKLKQFFISSALALAVAIVALGPTMQQFLSTIEFNKTTMRGGKSELTFNHEKKEDGLDKEYAFRWSNGIGETFSLMIPLLYGGASGESIGADSHTGEALGNFGVPQEYIDQITAQVPLYWGPQPFLLGPVYFGAVVCFLFVLGTMVVRSPHKWWIVAVSALAIIMSWGKNFAGFNFFLFDTLPGLNKFRIPSMILVLPQFLFPLLGLWALNDIVKDKISREELWKKTRIAVIITAGICLVIGIAGSMFFSYRSELSDASTAQRYSQMLNNKDAGNQIVKAIQEDRSSIASKSALTSAVYIILAGAAFWAFSRRKIKPQVLVIAVGLLASIDLISMAGRYLDADRYQEDADETAFQPRPVDQQILQDPDPYYRVLDVTKDIFNDGQQAYFHKVIGGHSPAKMEIYQDLIDVHLNGKFNMQVLNMLNTKYIIFAGGQKGEPVAMPNPDALGNAWFVNEVKWANTADDEILSMKANFLGDTTQVPNAFSPKTTAIMRNTYKNDLNGYAFGKDSVASVKLTKYGLDHLDFASNNSQNGLVVFSDIYYPHDWHAYVDGKETPIMKANYVLRTIKVPAGQHKIEFKFEAKAYENGDKIAAGCSALLVLLLVGSVVKNARKPEPEETEKEIDNV